jgi:hypothetical protein
MHTHTYVHTYFCICRYGSVVAVLVGNMRKAGTIAVSYSQILHTQYCIYRYTHLPICILLEHVQSWNHRCDCELFVNTTATTTTTTHHIAYIYINAYAYICILLQHVQF